MNWLTEPLQFMFMQQALLMGLLIAIPAAALSCLLVLKGWSLMGDAVSHAVLPGVVLAYVFNLPILLGAFIAGMFCSFATGFLSNNSRLKEDTVMGVVFSGMFALGLVLYTKLETNVHLDEILFGNLLGVNWGDVLQTGFISVAVLIIFLIKRRDILVFAFDPQHASAVGINTRLMHYGLLTLLSLVIVGSMHAVGIILVIAVLIAPGAISFMLVDRYESMIWCAMLVTASATVAGIYLSYYIDSAPAPTVVLLLTIIFMLSFLFAPKRGVFYQRKIRKKSG